MTWAMIKDKKKMVTSLDKVDEEILIMEKENIALEEEQEIPTNDPHQKKWVVRKNLQHKKTHYIRNGLTSLLLAY